MHDQTPSHFFVKGPYQVWAHTYRGEIGPLHLIAQDLCLESAKAFEKHWPNAEIRTNPHHYTNWKAQDHDQP